MVKEYIDWINTEPQEHVCGRHLNKRMEKLHDYQSRTQVIIIRSMRGGSVKCVVCGKSPPEWELYYKTHGYPK